jgi:hypothetical protein
VADVQPDLAPSCRVDLTWRKAAHLAGEAVAVQHFSAELCRDALCNCIPVFFGGFSVKRYCPGLRSALLGCSEAKVTVFLVESYGKGEGVPENEGSVVIGQRNDRAGTLICPVVRA